MKIRAIILLASFVFCFTGSVCAQGGNAIDGKVVDEHNVPVYNAFVELYNDFEQFMDRTRTSSQGRFTFRALKAGRYTVRVKPYGTNLSEDSQVVEIVNMSFLTGTMEYVNFRLRVDKRFESQRPTLKGTIYAQEVPIDAKRKYDSGVEKLKSGNSAAGMTDLEAAINILPTYFDALTLLGKEYVSLAKYEKGYSTLLRAIDVYPRCGDCYYSLGVAFYKLGQIPAGLKATSAAILLEPSAPEIRLLDGILLGLNGEFDQAVASLLKAESLYQKPNPEVHWQLFLAYYKLDKTVEAIERLESYLRDSPDIESKQKDSVRSLITKLKAAKGSKK